MMSFFPYLFRSRFFWQGDENKRKYRLAKWIILCQPRDQGGLGILDLNTKNIALLSKWLYKLLTSDGSTFGSSGMESWGLPLLVMPNEGKTRFSSLWNLSRKGRIPSKILEGRLAGWDLFKRPISRLLFGTNLINWLSLLSLSRIEGVELSQDQDTFRWNLTPNGRFSIKSLYAASMIRNIPNVNKELWKLKAPLKIKIFLWYLRKGVILTKDNLAKRNWQGSLTCASCHKDETITHLFFECRLA
ncbi:hypothetical protein U9M48_012634, partial [Paspalum notatum var. saurae]